MGWFRAMSSSLHPLASEDVVCPRCSWTLFTGGLTEDAHAAVCGPIPGRESPDEMFERLLKQSDDAGHREDPTDMFCQRHEENEDLKEGPHFLIGACPMPQIGSSDCAGRAGMPSACKLFTLAFDVDADFDDDGLLEADA